MRTATIAFACFLGLVAPAHAGLIDLQGGQALTLAGGSTDKAYDPVSSIDPWSAGQTVGRGAVPTIHPSSTSIVLTFLGREAGWKNSFELATGEVLFANHTSSPGDSVTVTVEQFLSAVFRSKGTGAGFGLGSERVAATFAGDTLQLGFNDTWGGDHDYDDLRLQAQVVPVPAALPLLGTAFAGLWGYRRLRTRSA